MPETRLHLSDLAASWELFRDPILCAIAAGLVLGYLGVFIVTRRMVFVAATLTQASGLGVALAFFAQIHLGFGLAPLAGALLVAGLAAWLLSLHTERFRISRESVLATLWLLAGGAAVMVGDRITQEAHDIAAILFGTAVLVSPEDLALVIGAGAVVLALAAWWRRGLVFAGFDPDGARVQGLPVRLLELGLLLLITVEVAVTTHALGALPVFAFSVLPGLAALMAAPRLSWAFPLALLGGAAAGGVGYVVAFLYGFPVGASQTVTAAALVALAAPLRLLRGSR